MKDIASVNRALVRLAGKEGSEKKLAELRKHRTDEGLEPCMDEREMIRACNEVSREEYIEGDAFMEMLDAVRAQEKAEAPEPKPEQQKKQMESSPQKLSESLQINEDGTINVCLITPGVGSGGYYSEALLKESVGVFTRGLHNYWDHPTTVEEHIRPERSLRDLAGVLAEDAQWQDQGFNGPGVYSTAKVFSPYLENLEEMAPHIGMSVVIYGMVHTGEIDGEQMDIIDVIVAARSVDYVTLPGRGGAVEGKFEALRESHRIKQLMESGVQPKEVTFHFEEASELSHDAIRDLLYDALKDKFNPNKEGYGPWPREVYDDYCIYSWDGKTYKISYNIDQTGTETVCNLGDPVEVVAVWQPVSESEREEETVVAEPTVKELQDQLKEAKDQLAERETIIRNQDDVLLRSAARDFVSKQFGEVKNIPAETKERLTEALVKEPIAKDGKLDEEATKAAVEAAVKAEAEYLSKLGFGKVTDLGPSTTENNNDNGDDPENEQFSKRLEGAFGSLGLSDEKLKTAVAGR